MFGNQAFGGLIGIAKGEEGSERRGAPLAKGGDMERHEKVGAARDRHLGQLPRIDNRANDGPLPRIREEPAARWIRHTRTSLMEIKCIPSVTEVFLKCSEKESVSGGVGEAWVS